MENYITAIFIMALLEFYESSWQKGPTIKAILENLYKRYEKGIFYFLFSHPTFYYTLYIGIKYNLTNGWFLTLLSLKFFDIAYKLTLLKKFQEGRLKEALPIPLQTPISSWMAYMNILIYPTLLAFALLD